MRSAPAILLLLAALITMGVSGCYSGAGRFGPPPPAYACDGYGCDGYDAYGGFSECVNDGQYLSRRDVRQQRRADRRAGRGMARGAGRGHGRGPTYNGLPVVAAYIVPMETMGGCECMSGDCFPGDCMSCGGMMGDCMSGDCMGCGDGCSTGGWPPSADCQSCGAASPCGPNGCGYDSQWQPQNGYATPSEVYPQTYPYDGQALEPMPVPPAQEVPEGDFHSPSAQPSPPQSFPESEARHPSVQNTQWLPAQLP